MRRSFFLLIIPLLAVASASAQVPPPTQKLLLVGHWQDATDPSAIIDVVEEYPGTLPAKDGAEVPLVISSHSCGGTTLGGREISTKPDGSWYLLAADEKCLLVVSVGTTKLAPSSVGGRGNTLTYKHLVVKRK